MYAFALRDWLSLALCLTSCDKWSDRGVAESKRRGDIVCQAVEAYRQKNARYPFQLNELRPELLCEIPEPTAGYKQWEYTVIDNETNYWLHVVARKGARFLDRNSDGSWHYLKRGCTELI